MTDEAAIPGNPPWVQPAQPDPAPAVDELSAVPTEWDDTVGDFLAGVLAAPLDDGVPGRQDSHAGDERPGGSLDLALAGFRDQALATLVTSGTRLVRKQVMARSGGWPLPPAGCTLKEPGCPDDRDARWRRGCDGAGSLDLVRLMVDILAYLVKADTREVRRLYSQRVALRFH
jgi:hypothetical protein